MPIEERVKQLPYQMLIDMRRIHAESAGAMAFANIACIS